MIPSLRRCRGQSSSVSPHQPGESQLLGHSLAPENHGFTAGPGCPGSGGKGGLRIGVSIVYAAATTGLCVNPVSAAIAFTVSDARTVNGPRYSVELFEGMLPFVVK